MAGRRHQVAPTMVLLLYCWPKQNRFLAGRKTVII
jgi:hypothetical protein